ncbi:MAG: carbonic anhydrase [Deltaproteobacteria bacterium]|nr:MAG: carbonic anhydrase [Deltaproteobacteria bacterium]
MLKLLQGVVDFHDNVLPKIQERFRELAEGQKPDALVVFCSDSRVAFNLFASTDPGEVFVLRNPGNLIPPCEKDLVPSAAAASIEIAVSLLNVRDVIICGHSRCGAMQALVDHEQDSPFLKEWVKHAHGARNYFSKINFEPDFTERDQLSQANVLLQMDHLLTYPKVKTLVESRQLQVHGWWFDIVTGNVFSYEEDLKKFQVIDQILFDKIQKRLFSK